MSSCRRTRALLEIGESYPGHNLRKIVNYRKLSHNIAQYREISRAPANQAHIRLGSWDAPKIGRVP